MGDFLAQMDHFSSPFNVHFCSIPVKSLLIGVSRARFFVKNMLYYFPMAKEKLRKMANASLAKSLNRLKEKKPHISLSFDSLVKRLHQAIETFPDIRKGKNLSKKLKDAALGGFAIFFTQNPSFLEYQKTMQETRGHNNAQSLFGIEEILSDNHIRTLLDGVAPVFVFPIFSYIFNVLNKSGYLDEEYRSFNNNILIGLDGTQYYNSKAIHCDNCNKKKHKNGSITYFHSVVTPVILKPGSNRVIALAPEFITPQDGHDKQDCENAAAKRWIKSNGSRLRQLGVTLTGDDLYCKQPICELILEEGLNFILVCKEESHKTLYEYLDYPVEDIRTVEVSRWEGKRYVVDSYRFLNSVPLRDGEDALEVNWCEIITRERDGDCDNDDDDDDDDDDSWEVTYKNAFVTDFEITRKNVEEIVADGRGRWKVENENNNVLKTKGYHLEHNFGHGKKNLSALFLTYNILAFLFHTILELVDEKYKVIRHTLPSRQTFFNDVRALTRYIYFDKWEALMCFMITGLKEKLHTLPLPDT
jgi:hypothetical protein